MLKIVLKILSKVFVGTERQLDRPPFCNGDQTSVPGFLTALPTHSPAAKPSGSSHAQLGSTWPERSPLWTAAFIFLSPNLHPPAFLYTLFILSSKINHARVSVLNSLYENRISYSLQSEDLWLTGQVFSPQSSKSLRAVEKRNPVIIL